jgi:predicted transcriptional regulator of viral defense system
MANLIALTCHLWQNISMEFDEMLQIVGDEPLFATGLLLAGDKDANNVRRQLVRWGAAGKVYQLRRGLYALAPPYQKTKPHPFLIANRLVEPSYVSLQSALAHYGLIPEYVAVVTSVTTDRPTQVETPLGRYQYQHIQRDWFLGFAPRRVEDGQEVYLATPEKALLDLVYLQPGGDELSYLRALRLKNLDQLDRNALWNLANDLGKPKLKRAVENIATIMVEEAEDTYETLPDSTG